MKLKKLSCALTFALMAGMAPAHAVPVGVELALLTDVSTSVNASEFDLLKAGYVDAFNNAAVQSAIQAVGGVAVTFIQWSSSTNQQQSIAWTLINDSASAGAFANEIGNMSRAFNGATVPAPAIDFAVPLFSNNGFEGQRLVIDIASDGGGQTTSVETSAARDAALNAGVTSINAIVVSSLTSVANFYSTHAIGGQNAFLLQTNDFNGFGDAIQEKLLRETTACRVADQSSCTVPAPGSVPLSAIGFLGLAAVMRRRFSPGL